MARTLLLLLPAVLSACAGRSGALGGPRIHDIQGAAQRSPLAGRSVRGVSGVVTAIAAHGFWFQDPEPDADPATSEGLFVYLEEPRAADAPLLAGDEVHVVGTVDEYVPASRTGQLPVTELNHATVTLVGHGRPLPPPVRVGRGGRLPPTEVFRADAPGGDATAGTFDPVRSGLDFWESLEGMRVELADPVACSPTSSLGELWVLADGGADATGRNARGGVTLRPGDSNPERVLLGPALAKIARADVGVRLAQGGAPRLVGVLDYAFGNFRLLPTAPVEVAGGGVAPQTVAPAADDELSVACFNLENFSAASDKAKVAALGRVIAVNLAAPDLVAVEELQDDSGTKKDGTVTAERGARALLDAITAAGGPAYRCADIAPEDGTDGGVPGGNIRCALLWREDRGLSLVARPGGDARTTATIGGPAGAPALSPSPALVSPLDPAFKDARKPLAAELAWRGAPLFVVACHLSSKFGDDPAEGARQPPVESSEPHRVAEAQVVRGFVDALVAAGGRAIVLGDLNDFWFGDAVGALTAGGGLVDLTNRLPDVERYTYLWQGNSQQLDHVLASAKLAAQCTDARPVHVNCEFAAQVSDHDPVIARFRLPPR
jgi:predicted extracellular nuclease